MYEKRFGLTLCAKMINICFNNHDLNFNLFCVMQSKTHTDFNVTQFVHTVIPNNFKHIPKMKVFFIDHNCILSKSFEKYECIGTYTYL